jgi:tetratricopeptide (TPR) repeat protein
MKVSTWVVVCFFLAALPAAAQNDATIKEYNKTFTTYPFSDPNPIPITEKIYPYFRYDGFTDKPVQKEWKVVELENDFIRVMILPEIGGKIWSAIEKGTGKSFIYDNHVVKFRDVAMRGPWTSGGIEPNYGIIGHTPNCATPVDYTTIKKNDGSVSCVIGTLDLLTRTPWRLEINLPKDKAYLTTTSFWYNATPLSQAYYTWMNTGIKAKGNLEFIYPGTHYLGHEGEYADWPINRNNGRNISFYENNDFGGYKSYHVFGKYTDFFGAYWHDEDFGMGRYSSHDDKAGKKIWIWGLSQQGMIWEKLLSDTDGQYVEVQSGRLFNQADVGSTVTPFKHAGFFPYSTDTWTEYWFPVKQTKGFLKANNYGAINLKRENGWLKIYFMPLQKIDDELKVMQDNRVIWSKAIHQPTLKLFIDSIQNADTGKAIVVSLGENKLVYTDDSTADILERPLESPKDFDWNSVYGLYLKGREEFDQRFYASAKEKLEACLQKDPNFIPALTEMAQLMLHNIQYQEAYTYAKKALRIDTYDPAANYFYGLANSYLGNYTNAKDGFDIASLGPEYRSAAWTELSKLYFRERNFPKALQYAAKSLDFNRFNLDAYKVMAVIHRVQKNENKRQQAIDTLLSLDPLNHFAAFEKFLPDGDEEAKRKFLSLVRNELPQETFLELATWYYRLDQSEDAFAVLTVGPELPELLYWKAFLKRNTPEGDLLLAKATAASPVLSFPFRPESLPVFQWAMTKDKGWKPKYYLGLIYWHVNNLSKAKELFQQCGNEPDFAPFYAGRAKLADEHSPAQKLADLEHAIQLDQTEWRYHKLLAEEYLLQERFSDALNVAGPFYRSHPNDYIMGMLYAKTLLLNNKFRESGAVLAKLNIIPFEGATDGRELYREAKLMQALEEMQKKKYSKAQQFIQEAKVWPINLGAGKPYDEDIDTRLEDWMAYLVYERTGKGDMAKTLLEKLGTIKNDYPQANHLVTALAMKKQGRGNEAIQWLEGLIKKFPGNKILLWARAELTGEGSSILQPNEKNVSVRILEQLKTFR